MIHKTLITIFIFWLGILQSQTQSYPWQRPLKIAWSNDGVTFAPPTIFQDSSGVPSVIRWKGDTLICVFQWFRGPVGSLSWDRVAVKFSYNNGSSWTNPVPIVVNGLPPNYQRPFDPTLAVFGGDSIRIYFSSSNGTPPMGLDSTVNTYSARSANGISYQFEPGARVNEATNQVIDPAVIYFNNSWHYAAPKGSPQQGAYHYVSPNGINFSSVPLIPSDNLHNWTGNYMVNTASELRFYGSGMGGIWYNSTSNGGVWNGYVTTNLQGGDPSALKVSNANYLIVFVGEQYATGLSEQASIRAMLYPNPVSESITILSEQHLAAHSYEIYSGEGKLILSGTSQAGRIPVGVLLPGLYLLVLKSDERPGESRTWKFSKE